MIACAVRREYRRPHYLNMPTISWPLRVSLWALTELSSVVLYTLLYVESNEPHPKLTAIVWITMFSMVLIRGLLVAQDPDEWDLVSNNSARGKYIAVHPVEPE